MRKRLVSFVLSVVIVLTSVDFSAFAEEPLSETAAIEENDTLEESGEAEEGSQNEQTINTDERNTETDTEKDIENEIESDKAEKDIEITKFDVVEMEKNEGNSTKVEPEETRADEVLSNVDGNIASGVIDEDYGHITWVIDADRKLMVEGTGDFADPNYTDIDRAPPWRGCEIKSAKINVTGMTNASYMFCHCKVRENIDLSEFDTSNVTDMHSMFFWCWFNSIDFSNFNTSNVTDMSYMFYCASGISSIDLSNFNTSNVTDMNGMFYAASGISSIDLSNFNTSNVTNMGSMFRLCSSLSNLNLSSFNTFNVTDMSGMFSGCRKLTSLDISNFNTSNVTDMSYMFNGCSSLINLDISNFNTSNVTDMEGMFGGCTLKNLNLSNFNTSNVTDMSYMFNGCTSTTLNLSGFDTGKVTNMADMFQDCSDLTNIDISNFDTSNVTSMRGMFGGCSSLTHLDLSNFDTSNVKDMEGMFGYQNKYENGATNRCDSLISIDISSFNTSNVTDMYAMFGGCKNLISIDISNFDTSNVRDMDYMFEGCNSLKTVYSPKNVTQSVVLPIFQSTDKWYQSDGTNVMELPQNLNYSVVLGKNYIPEKGEIPSPEDETIKQLVETGSSIFQFVDEMTGAPITNGRVCIEEEFSGTHYYKTNNDGRVNIPLSKDCKRVFVSTSFKGYKNLGGWTDLSYYRSESGAYVFRIEPSPDKYNPNLPSINTTVQTSAPPVETTDGDLNMFDMDMGFSLNFGKGLNFERTYDKNERTVKVAFSTEGKVSYDVIEEEYKASGYKSGKTLDEEFENAEDKMQPGKLCNVDVKTIVKGYLKCDEKGDLIEGGAIIAIKGEGNGEYRPAFAAGVAYGKFKLGLTTEGTLKFVYSDGNLNSSGIIKYEPYATLAVGVGWKLAHAEVGANGKFPIKMTIPYKSDKESLKIDSVFEIYGETVLFCFGGKHTWKTEWNIYPGTNSARNTNLKEFNSVLRPDYLEVLPRNYLSSNRSVGINTYYASNASGLTSSDSFRYSEISADAGVFKENNVQYVRLSDGTEILAWIHDFGDKSAVNRTTLVYSINKNDGKGWGSNTPVCSDTSTGDYYPNMVSEGNKAYLVWNKASKVFDDDVKTEDVCKNMDVYVSVFESDKFSEPQRISESGNALMEFSPLAAVDGENIAVAWLINSENDYHYTKGSNSVYVCEYQNGVWNSPTCYVRNLNYVSDYDVDYIDGQAAVLYAEDADNVSDTQDGTVYVVRNGVKTMIGDASYHAEIVDLCDNIVYFSGNHKVYKASGSQFSVIDDTGIETDNFSVMKSASGSEAVMFCKQDGFVCDIYVSYQRNDVYTSPVPIISNRSKVTNFASLFHDDGTISIAYNEESILADSAEIYGLTDMVVEKNVKPNVFLVDPELSYDACEVMPGNTITFSTGVSNFTTEAISSVRVTLTGSRSGEVYTGTQAVDIPVGAQTFVNVSYELPQTIVNEDYTLTVTPIGLKNIDLSNNRSKCELGYSDIAVSDVRIENDTIYGTITNIGYQTAKNVSFTIREDNEENVPFITVLRDKENFEAGERWEFSQKINAAKFEGIGDVKYYLISAETDSLENNYGNDTAVVFSEPTATTGIILDKTTLMLSEKTSAELHAQILPENATFKNAVYTSDANDIAAVDQDGTVYALKEGNAVITAYTLDGAQSAQCEVTVIPSEEKVGAISSRGFELKVKENNVLYVNDESGNIVEGITWSSTDETVVTVDQDGTVTAVGEGIALVVAQKDSFTDVCIVRVSDYVITLEQDSLTISLGDKKQINASVIPSDGVITYTSEDAGIASVSETGLVTGVGIGTTVIHVMVGDVTADCRVTVMECQGGGDVEDTDGVLPEDIPADGIIPDGLWIAAMADFDYIGEKIMPDAHVYDSNVRLRAGRDYTISYKNNINAAKATSAKAPTIIITGKGNYSGKETATFNILPADLSGDDFSMEAFYVKTGKKAQSPVPVIYYMGTKLKHKKDFTITYSNTSGVYATVGEYSATITGTGNYTGTREIKLTAVAKIVKTPSVSIAKASLAGFEKSFSYTGKAHKQECTLSVKTPEGEKTLTEGVDYTVRYTNNIKAGTAAVIYIGKNGYTGKLKKTYKIMPYNIMYDAESKLNYENFFECAYAKGGSKPKPVITYDGRKLAEGADYMLSYKNNKAVYGKRMPSVIVNGKGNFKGKLELYFTINPQDLSKMTLVSCDKVYQKKVGIYRITPKLMDLDGKLLSAGKDFDKNDLTYIYETAVTLENGVTKQAGDTVEDSDIIPADTQIRVTFGSGKGGNYTGTFTGVYRIVKADMKSAKVTIPNQTYTGKEITLDKSKITVTLSGTRLKPEDYEIIQYADNVKKGKAAVTIKGTGNYGGTKTVKFTIGAKGFLWWKKKD